MDGPDGYDEDRAILIPLGLLTEPPLLSASLLSCFSLRVREGSYLPRFDPRGVYDLPVCGRLSFAVSYASLAKMYLVWRARFYCLTPERAGCGVPPRTLR